MLAGSAGALSLATLACAPATEPATGPAPAPPGSSGVRVRWWGNNAWEIAFGDTISSTTSPATTILLDPWVTRFRTGTYTPAGADPHTPLSWNPGLVRECFPRADLVLLTHGHHDHITDVPYVAAATGATVLGTETHLNLMRALRTPDGTQAAPDQLSTVCGGELIQFPGCTVRVLRSLHSALGPRRAVPTHWDDFDLPVTAPAKDTGGLPALRQAIAAASPGTRFVVLDHRESLTP
jgi:L-ascorbate metabolism protein UlaG (beta-lactamase superfamily)